MSPLGTSPVQRLLLTDLAVKRSVLHRRKTRHYTILECRVIQKIMTDHHPMAPDKQVDLAKLN